MTHQDKLQEIIDFIKEATSNIKPAKDEWHWTKNNRCKSVSIHIDMRDCEFWLSDRNGDGLAIERLKEQRCPINMITQ